MNELSISVTIADRPYKLVVEKEHEELFRKAARLIEKRMKEYSNSYAYKDKQDLLAMVALESSTRYLQDEQVITEKEATWQQKVVKFTPGDLLVLFTDGVTEAQNRQGDFFGDQRLLDVIRRSVGRPAQDIQQAVLDEVQRFTGGAPREDDIALMILARKN